MKIASGAAAGSFLKGFMSTLRWLAQAAQSKATRPPYRCIIRHTLCISNVIPVTLEAAEKLPSSSGDVSELAPIACSVVDRLSYANLPVVAHAGISITLAVVSLHAVVISRIHNL